MVSDESTKIYLDYAASTPLDERVLAEMIPYFGETFGNASSTHRWGQKAEAAIETARARIAEILNCQPGEILFTSGGTESDNLALIGAALAAYTIRAAHHVLISPVEHPAIARSARWLAKHFGFDVELLPVNEYGLVAPEDLKARLRTDTALVSVVYANNEIGTINPIAELAAICNAANIPFHTDAVQAAAHLPIDLARLPVNLLSLGGHKLYGPKGIGVLFVRSGTTLASLMGGGGQEHGLRPGTSNTPLIVGLAEALTIAHHEIPRHSARTIPLRDQLLTQIPKKIPGTKVTGHPQQRLPNHASFVFESVDGNELLMVLDSHGLACSSGSACKTGNPEPSETLLALGLEPQWALGSLRVTLGRTTTQTHINTLLAVLPQAITASRQLERAP